MYIYWFIFLGASLLIPLSLPLRVTAVTEKIASMSVEKKLTKKQEEELAMAALEAADDLRYVLLSYIILKH